MKSKAKEEPKYILGKMPDEHKDMFSGKAPEPFHRIFIHRKTGKKYVTRNMLEFWAWQAEMPKQPSYSDRWEETHIILGTRKFPHTLFGVVDGQASDQHWTSKRN